MRHLPTARTPRTGSSRCPPRCRPLPTRSAAFQAMMKTQPTWPKFTKFMGEKRSEPQMATLLGLPTSMQEASHRRLSCQGCRAIEKN